MTVVDPSERDEHGPRPVEHLPSVGWFVASFVAYVVLGLTTRTLVLNWIVGPLWLVATLWLLPELWRSITRADRR